MRSLRLPETAKLIIQSGAGRIGLDLGRDPYPSRVYRTIRARGIRAVLDVGANQGQYSYLLRAAGFDGRLVSYEPVSDAYSRLRQRAAKDEAWETVNAAVGAVTGDLEINVAGNSQSSSALPMTEVHLKAAPDSAYQRTETVQVVTLDDEFARLDIDPATTLLKIDTQGYEEPALRGAASVLPSLAAVQLELSLVEVYEGQTLAAELVLTLASAGFTLWNLDPVISDVNGRLLQYDGLFVNASGTAGS